MTIIKRQGTRGPQDLLLKKKISSRSPSERYCQSIICSEHTFEQGLKPLEFMIISMGLPWTRIELKLRFFKILVLGLAQLFFGLWLLSLQYDWINILLNIPYIWFLSDRIFCVLISPARLRSAGWNSENQAQEQRSVTVLFLRLLLVASLKFSIVHLWV